jgi:hypothetical protein
MCDTALEMLSPTLEAAAPKSTPNSRTPLAGLGDADATEEGEEKGREGLRPVARPDR